MHAGETPVNGGVLLPLLSLCLAALMALFRDVEFGHAVSTEELTLLLRETGVALLDPRLSSDQLSEETGSQMIRAINKVIIVHLLALLVEDQYLGHALKTSNSSIHSLQCKLQQGHRDMRLSRR